MQGGGQGPSTAEYQVQRPPSDKPLAQADPSWPGLIVSRCGGRMYCARTRYRPLLTRITASPSRWTPGGAEQQLRRDYQSRGGPDAEAVALRILLLLGRQSASTGGGLYSEVAVPSQPRVARGPASDNRRQGRTRIQVWLLRQRGAAAGATQF
ncbi:uncharacterized protein TRIVIDRAFT_61076 [Trichoderma virens Gv29-8]|uniref:Uncharacterized protein n=1 Tax=Hypocrea virens (strain Gv29-8 / FGSC 10586) TaxID=413071 RepID=G9MLP9_HYPVG|nr:uncharacterized protein TRIVIDRAFT_61076 [Trichoderma virens Gv29-8]EHK24276.1 hypothetical protein TRIVIDRAFT_61076 [Trichoderma virens Gv29-8]